MTFDLIMTVDPICLSRGSLGPNLFALLYFRPHDVWFAAVAAVFVAFSAAF